MSLILRHASAQLAELADHLRIVMVGGPRQAGKTTLLRQFLKDRPGSYRTLDRVDTLRAAQEDPLAFASYGQPPRVIDEVQLAGDDLIRAIKVVVDEDQQPGRFLLSGSSRFLTVPTISESLAGRLAFVELWPLSMAERAGAESGFLRNIFIDPAGLLADSTWTREQYLDCVASGGYPEALRITSAVARRAWYDGYLHTVISRDIASFAAIAHSGAISRLLRLVAARAGSLANLTDLAQAVELARDTARNYLSYLDTVYLTMQLPAWSNNINARLTKAGKLYPTDSGLAAHLLGAQSDDLAIPGHPLVGVLVETFVATELMKAIAVTDLRVSAYHLRTEQKKEIDFILEGPQGQIVAIEVKATTTPGSNAMAGLRWLRERLGERLTAGILLHLGTEAASRGDRLFSMPLSVLWGHRPL